MSAMPESRFDGQVILALGAVPWEPAMVAALRHPASGMTVVRRCLDAADLRAAVKTTGARRVLVTAALPLMDLDVVRDLQDDGVMVVGVHRATIEPQDLMADSDRQQLEAWRVDHVVTFIAEQPGRTAVELAALSVTNVRRSPASEPTPLASSLPVRPHIVAAAPEPRGALHVIWGAPGSPGRSTVAITMADALSETEHRVLLIDADSDAPALAAMLAITEPGAGLVAALHRASAGRLQPEDLDDLTVPITRSLHLLAGAPAPMPRADLRPAALARILEVARTWADVVLVDLGSSPVPVPSGADHAAWAVVEAMTAADHVHVVGGADPVSLIRLIHALESLTDHDGVDPVLWITRVRAGVVHGSPVKAISAALTQAGIHQVPVFIPEDQQACDRALRDGATLAECAPHSPVLRVIQQWVRRHGTPAMAAPDHLPSARVRARAI